MIDTQSSKYTSQTIITNHVWIPNQLFSLCTTRDPHFFFEPGQFARIGIQDKSSIENESPTIWRAYSIVSAPNEPYLEFYSAVIATGRFSPILSILQTDDKIFIDKNAYGFFTINRFVSSGDVWLFAFGTGLSAYISMLRDSKIWENFRKIILIHLVYTFQELAYYKEIKNYKIHPLFSHYFDKNFEKLIYIPLSAQDFFVNFSISTFRSFLENGDLEKIANEQMNPTCSKVMICGNPEFSQTTRQVLYKRGFYLGKRGILGNLAVESYW